MPTPAVPTLTLCDQLVAELVSAWSPTGNDGAERCYEAVIGEAHVGRRVYVFPDMYAVAGGTRGENSYRHTVGILVAERYTDSVSGPPTLAWVDERVKFVYDRVVVGLDFSKDGALEFDGRYLVTESIDEVSVYNESELVQNRLFLSETRLTYLEIL